MAIGGSCERAGCGVGEDRLEREGGDAEVPVACGERTAAMSVGECWSFADDELVEPISLIRIKPMHTHSEIPQDHSTVSARDMPHPTG